VPGRHALAALLIRSGDLTNAARQLQVALQLEPDNHKVRELLQRVELASTNVAPSTNVDKKNDLLPK
jgi:protein involved in temperature-dependent protein secretion